MNLDVVKRSVFTVSFAALVALGACTVAPVGDTGVDGNGSVDTGAGGTDGNGTGEEPTDAKLVAFQDPDSDFSTSDVYDVDNEVVQFEADTQSLIWVADGTTYQPGTWTAEGNFLGATKFFQVRFGNFEGQRRAYFTETATATICNISTSSGNLSITGTNVPVPQ